MGLVGSDSPTSWKLYDSGINVLAAQEPEERWPLRFSPKRPDDAQGGTMKGSLSQAAKEERARLLENMKRFCFAELLTEGALCVTGARNPKEPTVSSFCG